MATFNVAEACVRMGADRLVNVSSETVAGMAFAERPFHAPYAQIDEDLVGHPQDPYALAKTFGEQLMDAMVARSDVQAVSIRPSWVQWEGNYERSLGPWLRDPFGFAPSVSFWSYVDVYDLAHALRLAAECELHDWHEAVYVVSADNGAGPAPGGADRSPLRRGRRGARPAARGRGRDLLRQGARTPRLRAPALLARLPHRGRSPRHRSGNQTRGRGHGSPARPRSTFVTKLVHVCCKRA